MKVAFDYESLKYHQRSCDKLLVTTNKPNNIIDDYK